MEKKIRFRYDVVFHDDDTSNDMGFNSSIDDCIQYIRTADRTSSYWPDYVGGCVEVVCIETGEVVYRESLMSPKSGFYKWTPGLFTAMNS